MIAKHRIGDLKQVHEEFAKSNPSKVWRHHLFWMLLGWITCMFAERISSLSIWLGFIGLDFGWSAVATGWLIVALKVAIWFLPVGALFIFARKHQPSQEQASIDSSFFSKWSFACLTTIGYLLCTTAPLLIQKWIHTSHHFNKLDQFISVFNIISMTTPILLMTLCVFLIRSSSMKLND